MISLTDSIFLRASVYDILSDGQEHYAFGILACLRQRGIEIREGELLPLLHMLPDTKHVTTKWRIAQDTDKPRRFYMITDDGRRELTVLQNKIKSLTAAAGIPV